MSIMTYKIELRINLEDKERAQAVYDNVKTVARELLALSSLLSEGPKPVINVTKAGFFQKEETISITEE